jgi:signal transduction histidine kinase
MRYFGTLRFKITLALIFFLLFACWGMSLIYVVNGVNQVNENIRKEGIFTAEIIASGSLPSLLGEDYPYLNQYLIEMKKTARFESASILNPEGIIVACTDRGQVGKKGKGIRVEAPSVKRVNKTMIAVAPIVQRNKYLGTVELTLTDILLQPGMTMVILEFFSFTLFSMIIGTILSINLSKKITRPLESLSQKVLDLKEGDLAKDFSLEVPYFFDEVKLLEHRFNQMIDGLRKREAEIQEKDLVVRRLAAGVAHKLNNIINIILGFSTILRRNIPPQSPEHGDIEVIIRESKKAHVIIENLISFAEPVELKKGSLEPTVLIEECITDLQSQINAQGIEIKRIHGKSVPQINADAERVREALFNIILNAVQAMPEGGILTLGCRSYDNNEIEIEIADTGIGIPEEVQSKIFYPLFTTKEEGWGIGLGLSTSYRIIEKHGGRIDFKSKEKEGTRFFIRLPVS